MSSSSATVAVEKATSDLLMGPDWTMNIEICDSVNSNRWQPKDVVKAVKKRLQHKSSKVQLLSLTLLETMVKNCGDYIHFQIAERNILDEMIKIVRKKTDMQVRDKILVLLDSWQEAFGGPGGKHPHYYWAYEELKRSGVVFPKRSPDAAPIFTPPPAHLALRHMQAGYGMPSNSSKRLDETMATEIESLSLSSLESMRHVMELLSDMLQAVNPSDRAAVKDEVIIDLVDRCRTNQKKLMQMLTTTGDEELLGRGLELNDGIQSLLAKHDAIASGAPLPSQYASSIAQSSEACSSSFSPTEERSSIPGDADSTLKANSSVLVHSVTKGQIDEEEEEEDEFAQLARRHSKAQSVPSKDATNGTNEVSATLETNSSTSDPTASVPTNALAIVDQATPASTTKEQDIIDLLSITLSTSPPPPPPPPSSSPHMPPPLSASSQQTDTSVPSSTQGYPHAPQYPGNVPFSNYVVPWAQPESKSESQPQSQQHIYRPQPSAQQPHPQHEAQQFQPQSSLQPQQSQFQNQHLRYPHPEPQQLQPQPQPQARPQFQSQTQPRPHFQSQTQPQPSQMLQPQHQLQLQNQHVQYPSSYPPPPWAATPGYPSSQNHLSSPNMFSTPPANTSASYRPAQGIRALQNNSSFSSKGTSTALTGDLGGNSGLANNTGAPGQKPFVPSYRLFEDLNVFGNTDGRIKMTGSGTSSSLSGTMGPGMVGGRK
ncbi:TOM1-like protein 6 isoform X1 [Neltuma alba]|uniref:TOM1-like protein 6 isoform X1 n=1 Tax=Neltuma alba TaxID=207710 RepID=UPI0010A51B14|nr:TOM1-like protein 6 isoform X1 [Prosopis alba]